MAEGRITQSQNGFEYYLRDSFLAAGQDSYAAPPSQDPDLFESLLNILPGQRGVLSRRWGYGLLNNAGIGADTFDKISLYDSDSGNLRYLILANNTAAEGPNGFGVIKAVTENGAAYYTITGPSAASRVPKSLCSREYLYISDGISADLVKWDGTAIASSVSKWGIDAPATAISVGVPVAGAVTLTKGRKYYAVFVNENSVHLSDLSPVSASTGPVDTKNIPLSSIPVSADAQVTKVYILATGDAGDETKLYQLGSVNNGVTTFTDTIPETTLLAGNVYLELNDQGLEIGVTDNQPPPNADFFTRHKGRLCAGLNQYIYFSKSLDELVTSTGAVTGRYEECWPASYVLDISEGAESIRGILSDGTTLYVGTEKHIRQILGDGPLNFQKPEILFNEVGVVNQEVWQIGFSEGNPVGAFWLTPDLKIIESDFNTYQDIGRPIQNILNTINRSAVVAAAEAVCVSKSAYDFYALAVPTGNSTTCNTLLMYDLQAKIWFVWQLTDNIACQTFFVDTSGKPRWYFSSASDSKFYEIDSSYTRDRIATNTPVDFTSSARTSWLNLGMPDSRKILQQLEVGTADPSMTIDIHGAQRISDFSSPLVVRSGGGLSTSPFREYKLYLAANTSTGKWYRMTFNSSANVDTFLDYFQLEFIPFHRS